MKHLLNCIMSFLFDEEGATAVEYALMVALIAVAIIAAVRFLGTSVSGKFSDVGAEINNSQIKISYGYKLVICEYMSVKRTVDR